MNASVKLDDDTKSIEFTIIDDENIKIDVEDTHDLLHTELILSKEQLKIAFRFILENKEGNI